MPPKRNNIIHFARLVSACYCKIRYHPREIAYLFYRNSNPRCPAVDDAQLSYKKVQKRKRFSRVRNFSILYGLPIGTLMTFARTSPSFPPC